MPRIQTTVKSYAGDKAYRRDAAKMAAKGWRVVNTTEERPRPGCGRIVGLGLFAAVFPPKPRLVVTYQKG